MVDFNREIPRVRPHRFAPQKASVPLAFDSHPGGAALLSLQPDLSMRWSVDSDQIIFRLDAGVVRRYGVSWCGDARLQAPIFEPRLELARQPVLGEVLMSLVALSRRRDHEADMALAVVQPQNRL